MIYVYSPFHHPPPPSRKVQKIHFLGGRGELRTKSDVSTMQKVCLSMYIYKLLSSTLSVHHLPALS